MSRAAAALSSLILTFAACGRVNFDVLDRSVMSRDGGTVRDASVMDADSIDGSRVDSGEPVDGGRGLDGRADGSGSVSFVPTCGMPECTCPPGPDPCEQFCFSEPCVVSCSGAQQCSAYCWSGVSCAASYEGAAGTTGSGAPGIAVSTAGLGLNDISTVTPIACGASCACPTDCTEVLGLHVADCGGDTPEAGGCAMDCPTNDGCSLYCGDFVGECAIRCGAERCVGTMGEWVSCIDGACRNGPPG